jgi:hypothetical protein
MTFLIFDDSIQFNLHKNVIKKTLDCGGKKNEKFKRWNVKWHWLIFLPSLMTIPLKIMGQFIDGQYFYMTAKSDLYRIESFFWIELVSNQNQIEKFLQLLDRKSIESKPIRFDSPGSVSKLWSVRIGRSSLVSLPEMKFHRSSDEKSQMMKYSSIHSPDQTPVHHWRRSDYISMLKKYSHAFNLTQKWTAVLQSLTRVSNCHKPGTASKINC